MSVLLRTIALSVVLFAGGLAQAHFAWLYVSDEAYTRLFFGEGLDDREYHMPEKVAAAEVLQTDIDAPDKRLEMSELEEEGFFGLEADDPIEPRGRIRTEVVYGNYHGAKLTYYAQHYTAENPHTWPDEADDELALQAVLTLEEGKLKSRVLWKGEPLTGVSVTLTHEGAEEGDEGVSAPVDGDGVATFSSDKLAEGLNGLRVMHGDASDQGELDGEPYTSAMHILTVTFRYAPEAAQVSALLPLPEAIASFGAAACDGWLYVYGGHIGQAHDHSRENLSAAFRRTRLDGEGGWEELPSGPPLQGLAMVAHGGRLYRVGGLDARNASGDDEDLHSIDSFARFDPEAGAWTELPAMPTPRSSHDAVVLDGTLYVVGGWRLTGDSDGEWRTGAVAFDLEDPDAEWRTLPEPPFRRRALAVGQHEGRVVAMCGMTDEADLSKETHLYDPETGEWSAGPEFPGMAFHGFGLSAWNEGGELYAAGMEGVVYRLQPEAAGWEKVAELTVRRFFHRLTSDGDGGLLAVAGASPEVGHTATIERVSADSFQTADNLESGEAVETANAEAATL